MKSTTHKGFTIVELLVTVVIIALLMGIVLTNLSESKLKSRDAKRVSDIAQIQLALELYFDRCNQYPILGANYLMNTTASNGCPVQSDGVTPLVTLGTFLGRIPTPPTSGNYRYAVNNNTAPTDYVLSARLEKPNQATTDDIDTNVTTYYITSTTAATPFAVGTVSCGDSSTTSYYCVQPR